ncbi:MAG: hypothetical protein DWQ04_11160 [Chloroflexi bacterium]|nr:MAG: hypothetical protein DWQ04_11160 [Chloroflexota bacterium]
MNEKHQQAIDLILVEIRAELDLSSETETELLEEIQGHLEDAVETATSAALSAGVSHGQNVETALLDVAERFGARDVGRALQEVHAPWESADAIIACIIPVVAALILRWIVFAPDGSAIGWQEILVRPAFWIVAFATLLVPMFQFQRWQYALISWTFFWAITVIFIALPTIQNW